MQRAAGRLRGGNPWVMLRDRKKIGMREALELIPLRAPMVQMRPEGEQTKLVVERARTRMAAFLSKFFTIPSEKSFMLDRYGSEVWKLSDGTKNVKTIASKLSREFGWPQENAQRAVLMFLTRLSQRRLVSFSSSPSVR